MLAEEYLDLYEKEYITEMAFSRETIISKLFDIGHPIIEHLIKILKWEDEQNYQKHIGDMDRNWFNKIMYPVLLMKSNKGTKAVPTELYFEMLFDGWLGERIQYEHWLKKLTKKYNKHTVLIEDNDLLLGILKDILIKVSIDLNNGSFESIENYLPQKDIK